MSAKWFTGHIRLIIIFVGAIMIPTILLGYLAIRTAETEKLVVWEKLEKSYTSLANAISDELEDILISAEDDFRKSLYTLPAYNRGSLTRLSYRVENRHGVIGQVFFLDDKGNIIFPVDPNQERQANERKFPAPSKQERNIFEYHLTQAERREFKHENPKRAIDDYEQILEEIKHPVYRAIALNGIARCYAKMGSSQEAVGYYRDIIDNYGDVTQRWVNIPAMAYLQTASLQEKMNDINAAVETLVEFYDNIAGSKWDLDADEIGYFAEAAREKLLVHKKDDDVLLGDLEDKFADVDMRVAREVKLRQFLDDYRHLAADDMEQIARESNESSESMDHLVKYTSLFGPYLISYLTAKDINIPASNRVVAGFEVNLDYLSSQGFREVLSDFTVEEDIILAILDEDNEIIEAKHALSGRGNQFRDAPPETPIAVAASKALPFWKVGIYIKDPLALEKLSRRNASLRAFLIIGLLLAIAFGIYLSFREARRETELARLRSDFVANVSHELRTPLSSIQIFSETLKQNRAVSQDKQDQYLDTISSESDRLARLVDNVLDFSRLERSIKEFSFQPTDIGAVVASAVEAYKFYADQRGVSVNLKIAPGLPEIRADKEALAHVIMNLIDNALKYSEEGAEITVNVFHRGQNVVIQVVDKGVGIDGDDIKRIFDKFYRGKNVDNLGTGGTGLGLTLAKAVANAHGGDILVRSKKGQGSRFSVVLPVSEQ